MKPRSFIQFTWVFVLTTVLFVVGLASVNVVHDRTGILRALSIKRMNPTPGRMEVAAPGFFPMRGRDREAKALNSYWYRPQTAVIGSSNVMINVDTRQPALRQPDGRPGFNFGLLGISLAEIEDILRHLIVLGDVKTAVLGLEFFMFSAAQSPTGRIRDVPLASDPHFRLKRVALAGRHVLSLTSTLENLKPSFDEPAAPAAKPAEPKPPLPEVLQDPSRRDYLHMIDRAVTAGLFSADYPYSFADRQGHSTFDMLKNIVSMTRKAGVELHIYLTPHNARFYEIIRGVGYWDLYREWLRGLADAADELNRGEPCQRWVRILEFGSYSPLTTDMRPADVKTQSFKRHPDSIHFGTDLAREVIEETMGASPCGSANPPHGLVLSRQMVDAYLEQVEARRARFAADHPDHVADVRALLAGLGRLSH